MPVPTHKERQTERRKTGRKKEKKKVKNRKRKKSWSVVAHTFDPGQPGGCIEKPCLEGDTEGDTERKRTILAV